MSLRQIKHQVWTNATRWKWFVSFTHRLIYRRGNSRRYPREEAEHTLDFIWTLRIDTRFLGLRNRSLVTYWMHYPGPTPEKCINLCDLFPLHALSTRKIFPFSNTGYSVPSLWKHFSAFAVDYLAIDTKQRHCYTDAHTRWLALSVGFPRAAVLGLQVYRLFERQVRRFIGPIQGSPTRFLG